MAAHLEAQILAGKLKPGDRLPPERDLQARFGVGRPAIREALITLQKAGPGRDRQRRPRRVLMPTASHIFTGMAPAVRQMLSTEEGQRHFQGARLFFEVGLAREAARTRDADGPGIAARRRSKPTGRRSATASASPSTDVAFHFELARIARNPVFVALHDQISEWLKEQRVVTLAASGQEQIAYEAHRAIYEGIAARDPDRAEQAMRDASRPADDDVLAPARESTDATNEDRRHRRRLHRLRRHRQHARQGRRADRPICRHPDRPLRGRNDRCRRHRAEDALDRSRPRRSAQSLAACRWLVANGAEQIVFKYCSTFDSTPEGNIGPVAEALLAELGAPLALVCPAFPGQRPHALPGPSLRRRPAAQRVRHGKHPLTPMTDPDIRRWLSRQTRREGRPSAAARSCGGRPRRPRCALRERRRASG